MIFNSYHWRRSVLSTPELERARGQVSATRDRASFALLLRSNDMAAVGVAFDQYQYGEASSRWGSSNPFAEYQDEVAARAREILRGLPSSNSSGAQSGANHASALNALSNLAEPEDAELSCELWSSHLRRTCDVLRRSQLAVCLRRRLCQTNN